VCVCVCVCVCAFVSNMHVTWKGRTQMCPNIQCKCAKRRLTWLAHKKANVQMPIRALMAMLAGAANHVQTNFAAAALVRQCMVTGHDRTHVQQLCLACQH